MRQSSPASVEVTCFYLSSHQSPESSMSSITIHSPPPELSVNPLVTTETDSVTLNCQTPSSVSVAECFLYFTSPKTAKEVSCLHTMTGTELLSMTHQSSPAEVEVTCYYTLKNKGQYQSPQSKVIHISIQTPPPELSVNPPVITETDSVTLTCQTPSSVSVAECFLYFTSPKTAKEVSCLHTMTGTELLSMTHQSSPAKVEVTCYYTLKNKGQYRSPQSKVIHISIQSPHERITTITQITPTSNDTIESTMTQTTLSPCETTGSSTSALLPVTTLKPTSQLSKWKLLVAAPACGATVGIIVLGVALVCAKRRSGKRFHNRSQANVTGDFVCMVDRGQLLPAGNAEMYTGGDCPAGFKQLNRRGPQNEDVNPDIYHVYSTILEEPAASDQKDFTYSTIQTQCNTTF
ncbi:transcription initiation factor TFIID subunit 12-like isoform X2 [Embiotoca jacksoni]|uniref:transcription initiation factor TFIID subunit 12-like isoform X2 n=1 Tax=Embiotoca jacksoni TaxID=100190 RepID=UPI0037047AEE